MIIICLVVHNISRWTCKISMYCCYRMCSRHTCYRDILYMYLRCCTVAIHVCTQQFPANKYYILNISRYTNHWIGVLTKFSKVTDSEPVWKWFIQKELIVSSHYQVSYLEVLCTFPGESPTNNIHIQEAELCLLLHTQVKMRSLHQVHNPSHR